MFTVVPSSALRRTLHLFALVLGASAFPSRSWAADHYVAVDGTGPGTEQAPTGSLQACVDAIGDGDTCYVRAGTYRLLEQLGIWDKDGSANAPRRLAAYPGERPIIDGTAVVAASSNAPIVVGSGYWIVEGLDVVNSRTAGIQGWGAHHAQIRNNKVHRCRGAGIALFWSGPTTAHQGVVIEGNEVFDCALDNETHSAMSWPAGIAVQLGQGAVVRNNDVRRVHGEGILSYLSTNVTFQGNVIHDTYSTCLYFDNTTQSLIERNFCHQTHDPRFFPESPPNNLRPHNGVQIANEHYNSSNPSADNVVRNNVIVGAMHGFYYGNYQLGGGLVRTSVSNNVFFSSVAAAVHVDPDTHDSSRFANNVFVIANGAVGTNTPDGFSSISFDHNLWQGTPEPVLRGEGDVLADAELQDPGADDPIAYRPSASSPAKGAGTDLRGSVPDDFAGVARQVPFDMGAFELKPSAGGGGSGGGGVDGSAGTVNGSGGNAGGAGGSGPTSGGAAASGSPEPDATEAEDSTGCSCRTAARTTGNSTLSIICAWCGAWAALFARRRGSGRRSAAG